MTALVQELYVGPGTSTSYGTPEPIDSVPGTFSAPASYTLEPSYVTPVKNQGGCGSCWAFATYGAMESNILMSDGPAENLSENHLIHNHGYDLDPCAGGNYAMSIAYMSRLDGPVYEADDPYPYGYGDGGSTPDGYARPYFLHDACIYDTVSEIKNALMDIGALATPMYWENTYFRSSDDTYYYSGAKACDHAVTIVGWDDAKQTAGGTGAWRIKNSWGSSWGDDGYFWLSYNDTKGAKTAVSFEPATVDRTRGAYQHDEFGNVSTLNTPYAVNVFQAHSEALIGSLGFYTAVDGTGYDVRVYDTFSADSGCSGELARLTGTLPYEGFHVVDLDPWVMLPDDDFALYLYLDSGYTSGDDTYYQAFEKTVVDYCTSTSAPGQSYYSFDGSSWSDLYAWDSTANFALKAYETPEPTAMALVLLGVGAIGVWSRRPRRKKGIEV